MTNSENIDKKNQDNISALIPKKKGGTVDSQDALNIVLNAMNSTVGGLIITDLDGTIKYVNPSFCNIFNYTYDEILETNAADLFLTKEIRNFSDVLTIIDISRDTTEEFIVKTSEDNNLIVEVSASNVFSNSGQLVGRMASFNDITKKGTRD